ncbi:hypothetical protein CAOG_02210 [Capsaspora owczarzaki ATCC 30864]|uniref:Uncharacterized protein n=1 Tax=Capsaspora owczarzaki (strain ATCC 30864) TaxID=595528 RepID=A0A0D2U786_CAPO3|nr:hypothetical protein CAOG_02210 [Capsaspora owczarzaki ATCC 30864]KJE91001.1 hypothetical protein CAOG_002210 [Capsaspora owczarzaki ATCC 30864]|eukprot:XP_004348960.1 hypothetical protein CAOG_02210 [Capsaspora owczarzaki ATCC 30864]
MSAMTAIIADVKQYKEILPLLAVVGTAVTYGVGSMIHTARKTDVVFDHRNNPFPWQQVAETAAPKAHQRRP